MDLDDFIITTFCMIDDTMKDILGSGRLRQRGPAPALSDSEVLTIEVVGEYLRLHQDKAIFDYFQRHYSHFFPAIRTLHRTTFVRQAANLRSVKELVWQGILAQTPFDPEFHVIDSIPLPACQVRGAHTDVGASKAMPPSDTTPWLGRHSTASVCARWWRGPASSSASA